MKILTVYPRNRGGGSFKRLIAAIEAMLEKGWEVHYVAIGKFPLESSNLKLHRVPRLFFMFPNNLFQEIIFFCYSWFFLQPIVVYLTMKYKPDVFVIFGSQYSFSCFLAKLFFRIPLITFVRGDWIRDLFARVQGKGKILIRFCMLIDKIGLKYSDKICVVTKDLRKSLTKRYNLHKKMEILYNHVDILKFHSYPINQKIVKEFGITENKFVIGFVGSLDPIKRVDFLLSAVAKITPPTYLLILVGAGRLEKKLKQLAIDLNIENNVIFTGWRDNISEIIPLFDLLVLPSEYEGCPNVLLEALSCDVPCIGSKVGGIPEILHYPDLLFELSNSRELFDKIKRIIMDENYYKKIKILCSQRRDRFTFDWDKKVIEKIKSGVKNASYNCLPH